MAVEAVLSVVIQKLTYLLIQESNVFNEVVDEVEEVRIMLRDMQSFLKDAEYQEESDEEFHKGVAEFLRTVYHVKDVIETFALGSIRLGRMGFIKKYAEVIKNELHACRRLPNETDGNISNMHALKRNMDRIRERICNIRKTMEKCKRNKPHLDSLPAGNQIRSARGSSYHRDEAQILPHLQRKYSEYLEEESPIVGFKKKVKMLVTQLTNNNKQRLVISVLGEVGSGKTTLAKEIYNKGQIKELFQNRAWVIVSKDYTVRDLLLVILKQITRLKEEEKLNTEALKNRLCECLQDKTKRYLIVIDDVWEADVWNELKVALPDDVLNGSRVMFTTCDKDVALLADPWKRHKLEPLDDDGSWNLFLKKAPLPKGDPFLHVFMLDLKDAVKEICKGLPLRIVMLGGLLSTKRASSEEWRRVLEQYQSWLPTRPTFQSSDIITFCYNDLPVHLKPCFLYLGLFPRDFEIPVRRLFRLWLAEGYVRKSPGIIPEDLVEEYLEELVNRNMVEISKRRSDGSLKRCRMLGILHDIFLPKAVDMGLFYIHRKSDYNSVAAPPFGVRRVVEYVDIKDYPSSEAYTQNIQSYLSFNFQKKDMSAVEIGNFLDLKVLRPRGFGLLRVLDLEGVYKPSLPKDLGNLFHLRYLGLRWTFLDTLPSSVGDLPYLETLDIKHTYISTLPRSIWKMKHLRHLCLNETRLDMSVQRPSRGSLTQLQTLWGLFVDQKSQGKNGLNRLINLRKVGLTSHPDNFKDLGVWIATLANLQSLRLRSKDKMGRPSELHLPLLSSLENLSHLYLLGSLHKLPARYQYPPGLCVLTLSVSLLEKDPMPTLAQLPSLTVLRLLADSYVGKEMDCPPQGFLALRVLKLWKLEKLEKWTVHDGAMQNLRALEIRCCEKLMELPDRLLQLGTFEKLILTNMPPEFVEGIQAKRQKHTFKLNNRKFLVP